MFKNYFLIMIICILTTSCDKGYQEDTLTPRDIKKKGPIAPFVDRKASIAVGVNAKTNQPFLLDSKNGLTLAACDEPDIDINKYQNRDINKNPKKSSCKLRLSESKSNSELITLIEKTRSKITGVFVNNKGEEITLHLNLAILSARPGSYCSTHFVAGRQYENCVSQQEECDEYRNIDYPPSEASLDDFLLDYPECEGMITQ